MSVDFREALWLANLSASLFGFLIWLTWMRFNWLQRRYALPPLSLFLHSLIYFAARLLVSHDPHPIFQVWSTALIAHGLGIGIGVGLVWLRVVRYGV